MSARSGSATASRPHAPGSGSATAISATDATRLWKDWQQQADKAERLQADPDLGKPEKRILAMQVRVLDCCVADLRELLEGNKPHPVKRRESD